MAIVNEREFKKYVMPQQIGETNMVDIAYVVKATGLGAYIMQQYAELKKVYGIAEPPKMFDAMEAVKIAMVEQELKLHLNMVEPFDIQAMIGLAAGDDDE